jgi:hypothetical protein
MGLTHSSAKLGETGTNLEHESLRERGKAEYALGIDLGTSHCALSYKKLNAPLDEKPQILKISQWESDNTFIESTLLPSWYYFTTKSEMKRELFSSLNPREDESKGPPYVVGRVARNRALQNPQRVIHSAKSWLVAGHVDRRSKLLPWGSDVIVGSDRKSPVEVSAAYLTALRMQWNQSFPEAPFEDQFLTITVPASFDEVAQRLTLEALDQSLEGGVTKKSGVVKLLEEPQAAFYASTDTIRKIFKPHTESVPEPVILVCDIGGGTCDFSLFKMTWDQIDGEPRFIRIAVSEHILLGGDNIDLALAHDIEKSQIQGEPLSAAEFQMLTHSVRQLKEDILGSEDQSPEDKQHRIGILAGGVSTAGQKLFQSARSVSITKKQMLEIINEGFFPKVGRQATPQRHKGGLRQLGLPYAQDTGVTRYLAEFLAPFYDQKLRYSDGYLESLPVIDGVLLVGGTLKPTCLQERLLGQIGDWQGVKPALIPLDSLELAVAEGAALYGYLRGHLSANAARPEDSQSQKLSTHNTRNLANGLIGGGYPRSLYLEVHGEEKTKSKLVCLVPKGYEGQHAEPLEIKKLPLFATVNQTARFQMWSSRLRSGDQVGDLISLTKEELKDFEPLPPLSAILKAPLKAPSWEAKGLKKKGDSKNKKEMGEIKGGKEQSEKKKVSGHGGSESAHSKLIAVSLTAELADTGILILRCIPHAEELLKGVPGEGWPLDFSLRSSLIEVGDHVDTDNSCELPPESSPDLIPANDLLVSQIEPLEMIRGPISKTIERVYGKKSGEEELSPKGLLKELERVIGNSKEAWDLSQLRIVCDAVLAHGARRSRSSLHEATWMNLAGYTLRPGYGESKDAERMGVLLRSLESGLGFSKERNVQEQLWILQRRVCGGMTNTDQDRVLAKLMPMVRKNEAPSQEVYRLVGVLERADMQEKIKLGSILVQQIIAKRPPFLDQKVWTLGRMMGRTLLYGEVQHIVSPTIVAEWLGELWKIPVSSELYPRLGWVWSQGARMVQAREFNVDDATRRKALERLRSTKASPGMIECVERFIPPDETLKTQLFGEKLPLGLILGPT